MKNKILVVDDEPDVVEFLTVLLEDNGYMVSSTTDGVKAMEMIKLSKPDLIILDLLMPEETGTGLCRKIRNRTEFRNIPIIIVSGLEGRNLIVNKSVPVLDKPINEQQILKEVKKFLEKKISKD